MEVFFKEVAFKNFVKFSGKHLCRVSTAEKHLCQSLYSLMHNFIQQSLNSGSAQAQILLGSCGRFAMVKIFGGGPGWK